MIEPIVTEFVTFAVTVPAMVWLVGKFPMVTEEMLTGTVPLMLAVTDPIWAVPAAKAGKLLTVTVPLIAGPTVTVMFSRAARLFASSATVTVLATVTVEDKAPLMTGWDSVTTDGVSVKDR
jgi:hypothetical protein